LALAPCSGTIPSVTSPNDIGDAAWLKDDVDVLGGGAHLAPDGTFTASEGQSIASVDAFISQIVIASASAGVPYRFTGYLKSLEGGPNWMRCDISDFVANAGQVWFDFKNGVKGTVNNVGDATVQCSQITASNNGYWFFDFSVSFTSAHSDVRFVFLWADADGGTTATIGQDFDFWGIGTT
jgi:hypothetical protein